MNQEIIVRDYLKGEVFVGQDLIGSICHALAKAETVITVCDQKTQEQAVEAQRALHTLIAGVNKAREAAKRPVIDLGRKIDQLAKDTTAELEDELKRVTACIVEYQQEQQRIAAAAEAKRQEELRRVEAENRRREEEAREAQRKAELEYQREQQRIAEAARKVEQEATSARNNAARVKAEADRAELMRMQREHEARVAAEREAAAKEAEKRGDSAAKAVEQVGRAVEAPTVKGQIVRRDVEVIVHDVHALYRDKPNAVALEARIGYLKELYYEGQTNIKGVTFREKLISTVRAGSQKVLDV